MENITLKKELNQQIRVFLVYQGITVQVQLIQSLLENEILAIIVQPVHYLPPKM